MKSPIDFNIFIASMFVMIHLFLSCIFCISSFFCSVDLFDNNSHSIEKTEKFFSDHTDISIFNSTNHLSLFLQKTSRRHHVRFFQTNTFSILSSPIFYLISAIKKNDNKYHTIFSRHIFPPIQFFEILLI